VVYADFVNKCLAQWDGATIFLDYVKIKVICISRRLINIIYGMLKSGTEYRMPVVEDTGEKL
jgi:hypothetical protein